MVSVAHRAGLFPPKLDMSGCVLYTPLWRPDMVARGGRIIDGTGICTGSPLHLAVGANTVAVTQAGTFTVYMPEGGTVATGTMTVTGSPVTVSAGIAATITTTGATGDITVTSSNIIRSRDKLNHAMTVTGATWGSQGRTFNGTSHQLLTTDNLITDANVLNWTCIAWVKVTGGAGTRRTIFSTKTTFDLAMEANASNQWQANVQTALPGSGNLNQNAGLLL